MKDYETMDAYLADLPPNVLQQFKSELDALPPEQREARLMAMVKDYAGAGDLGGDQMRQGGALLGNALRNKPQGRTTSGGLYTAANPLEHAANLAQAYVGNKRYNEGLDTRKEALAGADTTRSDAFMRALRGG